MIITHDLVPDLACPWKSLGNKDLSQSHEALDADTSLARDSHRCRDSRPIGFPSLGNSNWLYKRKLGTIKWLAVAQNSGEVIMLCVCLQPMTPTLQLTVIAGKKIYTTFLFSKLTKQNAFTIVSQDVLNLAEKVMCMY